MGREKIVCPAQSLSHWHDYDGLSFWIVSVVSVFNFHPQYFTVVLRRILRMIAESSLFLSLGVIFVQSFSEICVAWPYDKIMLKLILEPI